MTNIEINHAQFDANLRRYAMASSQGVKKAIKRKMRTVMKRVILMTPPSSKNVTGSLAKKQGEAAIERDMAKMFKIVPNNDTEKKNYTDMVFIQRALRTRRRINNLSNKYKVRGIDYRKLQRVLKKRVGYLASGWHSSISIVNVPGIPAWIKNKQAPSECSFVVSGWTYKFKASNNAKYANNVSSMDTRIYLALTYEAQSLENEWQAYQNSLNTNL